MHRIPSAITHAFEFVALVASMALAQINGLLDETTWDRLTGRHGALFFMAIALLIIWNSSRLAEKRRIEHLALIEDKEDERREREEELRQIENDAREQRHREAMKLQQENSQRLMELTVEGIKAQGMVAEALKTLKSELDGRPCGLAAIDRKNAENHPVP